MGAGFGWIDFSDEQRQKVFAVIDLLDEGGTVDELGIGVVRDALADWMFPGVSTIQTRPKYFLILTEILNNYQRDFVNGKKVIALDDYLTKEENKAMHLLAKNYNYSAGNGVIGISKARNNQELARKASFIYWNGLRIHGLIKTQLSRTEYVKANNLVGLDNDLEAVNNNVLNLGLIDLPFTVIDEEMNMDLNQEQAAFLKDQFLDSNSHLEKNPNNLLSAILKDKSKIELLKGADGFNQAANLLLETNDLEIETAQIVKMALNFDLLIHGAHIRYNIQLHKKAGTYTTQNDLEEQWEHWLKEIKLSRNEIAAFNFDEVFASIAKRVGLVSKEFMRNWQKEIFQTPINTAVLDNLVYNQEVYKKGSKAKLTLKNEEYNGWVGIYRLEYRFGNVKNIIKDLEVAYA